MMYIVAVYTVFHVFFFNDTATTEIYTLSLHDALPISRREPAGGRSLSGRTPSRRSCRRSAARSPGSPTPRRAACRGMRSEEHTSELQSLAYLVCRLLLEKKKRQVKYEYRTSKIG